MDKLLPYYEQELSLFVKQSQAFATLYPKVANRLMITGESVEDPHVERLIQAFSLIAARIHKKLDDGYEDFTSSLFEVLYPGYLKPFPSCSIMSLEHGVKLNQLTEPLCADRGTMFSAKPYHGVSCRFKTVYPVQVLPLQISALNFKVSSTEDAYQYTNASLKINFSHLSEGFDKAKISLKPLRLFLDAPHFSVARLRDTLLDSATVVRAGSSMHTLSPIKNPFSMVGFVPDDSLLPIDDHAHHAYRLISEYFSFSDKFNFIDLDLSKIKHIIHSNAKDFCIELRFRLDTNESKYIKAFSQLNEKNIKLFCTPVINLFDKPAEPIRVNHKQQKYHVVGDVHHPEFFEIYSIKKLTVIREDKNKTQVVQEAVPFFSLNHVGAQQQKYYYHISREQGTNAVNSGYDYQITLVDHLCDVSSVHADYLSLDLMCTNRQLPSKIPFGMPQGDLVQDDSGPFRQARFLRKPTPSYRFNHANDGRWRIISHLSLNTLALNDDNNDVNLLKEALTLYELPHSPDNLKQIDGIKKVEFQPATLLVPSSPYPLFIRGIEVRIMLDPESLIGTGVQLMGQLLSHIFGLRVNLNNFIKVILVDFVTGQELLVCPPLNGFRKLV